MFVKSFQYLEMSLVAKLIVPGVTKRGEVSAKKKVIENAFNLGKSLGLEIS